jgi:hypothetical protein
MHGRKSLKLRILVLKSLEVPATSVGTVQGTAKRTLRIKNFLFFMLNEFQILEPSKRQFSNRVSFKDHTFH